MNAVQEKNERSSRISARTEARHQALRQAHGEIYDAHGRWVLAAAPVAGWALGVSFDVSEVALAALFALLAGGIVLNVLKEELPEERESRFSAFAIGAMAYAAILLATR